MAMYAQSLLRHDNIKALTITTGTVDRYLQAAAAQIRFATLEKNLEYFDPRYDRHHRPAPPLAKVKQAHSRWSKMPSRREPVTVAMLLFMKALASNSCSTSLHAAHFDWQVLGHYFGFRKSEWCQDVDAIRRRAFARAPSGELLATMIDDITFLGVNDYELQSGSFALNNPDLVHAVRYRWRFQKNGDNGATRTLARNTTCPALCPVHAALRILRRAQDLGLQPSDPLAVYASTSKIGYSFISNIDVQTLLQQAAKRAYNIKDARLRLWSCHSMRVGACVALFNSKHSPDRIQHLLRWKSATWRDYLRDCSSLSHSQLDGISAAARRLIELKLETQCD